LISTNQKLHYLKPYRHRNILILSELLGEKPDAVVAGFSIELTKAIIKMRLIKSAEELKEL
jgi:Xaa-Pro aminopeptidase